MCLLDGDPVYIFDPLPGKTHDATAYDETPVADIVANSGGGIADKGYQGRDMVTPRKTPRGGELSKTDKESNTEISALRSPRSVHVRDLSVFNGLLIRSAHRSG